MGKADDRRNAQLGFLSRKEALEAGDISKLPMSVEEIEAVDKNSGCVEKHIKSGLTADIYRILAGGKRWNLKKKRSEILVKNIDGQTSFLNEIQRRRDFERLKSENPGAYSGIVDTVYASLEKGFILSPWIEGGPVKKYTPEILKGLFNTLYYIEIAGLFEYDLCSGNLLLQEDGTVRLFDFGYMYPYDPLNEYNPDGLENPVFHLAERFESRNFMQYLMDLEERSGFNMAMQEYRFEKAAALECYNKKYAWLEKNRASETILSRVGGIIKSWEHGLSSDAGLENLYALESFRSYVIDVHDDVGGKSCTVETVKKVECVLTQLASDYGFLKENRAFFWGDENLDWAELMRKYGDMKKKALEYQI